MSCLAELVQQDPLLFYSHQLKKDVTNQIHETKTATQRAQESDKGVQSISIKSMGTICTNKSSPFMQVPRHHSTRNRTLSTNQSGRTILCSICMFPGVPGSALKTPSSRSPPGGMPTGHHVPRLKVGWHASLAKENFKVQQYNNLHKVSILVLQMALGICTFGFLVTSACWTKHHSTSG